MKPHHLHYLLIALISGLVLWIVWPDGDPVEQADSGSLQPAQMSPRMERDARDRVSLHRTAMQRKRTQSSHETHPAIDEILGDDNISISRAATLLRQMAVDPELRLKDRVDALEHGMNLDAQAFEPLADMRDLPSELAIILLDEVMNENDRPDFQLRTYMGLVRHPDPNVFEAAIEMLAFAVGDDLQEQDLPQLMAIGRQHLSQLEQEAESATSPSQ